MNSNIPNWTSFLENNKWTTYLAYQLKETNILNPVKTLLEYEALLTQCSYLSRMAYCPADIFCRMTQHLDVTPNAFNTYTRAIEKIYMRMFNYKDSYNSKYIQENSEFSKYFYQSELPTQENSSSIFSGVTSILGLNDPIGFFVQNKEHLNAYLYVHHNAGSKFNTKKTLFITFKGSSSINDFIHDLQSAIPFPGGVLDQLLSELAPNDIEEKQKSISGKAGYGFIKILKPSIKDLCAKIERLKSQKFERIIITGHSLGGALASLFGYYLKQYRSEFINVPIHVITFGACCVFDAQGRNDFNSFLNISENTPIFTLDRVTANFDPMIVLPADLDHPGYTLLKGIVDYKAFTKTGRTNEIGKIRKMLGLERGYDGNHLLLSERFVNLFKNLKDFMGTGKFDTDLYRDKFRIKFGSNAKEQQLILEIAMPDANPIKIRELFITIERDAANKRYNVPEQKQEGGLYNPLSRGSNATKRYKEKAEKMMPNQIQYSCYITMTMGFCHASYMGVSYVMVLRLPNIKGGYKAKKEPTMDYTLYKKNDRVFSLPSGDSYNSKTQASTVSRNTRNVNKPKNIVVSKPNRGVNKTNNKNSSSSFFNNVSGKLKGLFKTNNTSSQKNTIYINKPNKPNQPTQITKPMQPMQPIQPMQPMQPIQPMQSTQPKTIQVNSKKQEKQEEIENQGVFSKCSIL